jgi:dCTP deaminase
LTRKIGRVALTFSDSRIGLAVGAGSIKITPFDKDQINPASYDLTLHPILRVNFQIADKWKIGVPLDLSNVEEEYLQERSLDQLESYTMYPGEFLLASTMEFVELDTQTVGRVEGKSSLARVGLAVHVTGGFIDPGFRGHITLEMVNLFHRPLVIHPGMRIAQIAFMTMEGEVNRSYAETGRYQGQTGPTLSRYRTESYSGMTYTCPSCWWKGTYDDWERDTGEERWCESDARYKKVCPDDHCLECGRST